MRKLLVQTLRCFATQGSSIIGRLGTKQWPSSSASASRCKVSFAGIIGASVFWMRLIGLIRLMKRAEMWALWITQSGVWQAACIQFSACVQSCYKVARRRRRAKVLTMAPYVEVPLPALPKEEWKAVPWAAIRARLQAMVTELTDVLDGSDVRFHNKEVEEPPGIQGITDGTKNQLWKRKTPWTTTSVQSGKWLLHCNPH